jgi:SP family sugar:H+ symporter-like MFS transporter
VFTWVFVPECTGKSLEEIDFMFNEHVPLRKFKTYRAHEQLEKALKEDAVLTVESVKEKEECVTVENAASKV